jgi:VanZ family protein
MSTEMFSSENTFFWMETVLHLLVPTISHQNMGLIHAFIRKTGHLIEYFILGLLLFRAFSRGSTAGWNWRSSFFVVILVVLWASIDELHQSFVPTRTASLTDVGIDIVGVVFSQLVIALWHRHRRK